MHRHLSKSDAVLNAENSELRLMGYRPAERNGWLSQVSPRSSQCFRVRAGLAFGGQTNAVTFDQRYEGSLQLFDAENEDGDRSLPQIQSPALLGFFWKCSFRSPKYLSIAPLASSSVA